MKGRLQNCTAVSQIVVFHSVASQSVEVQQQTLELADACQYPVTVMPSSKAMFPDKRMKGGVHRIKHACRVVCTLL